MTSNDNSAPGLDTDEKTRIDAAKAAIGDAVAATKSTVASAYYGAVSKTGDAYGSAKDKTAAAYEAAREKSGRAYAGAREAAHDARERTTEEIGENPLIALAGGLAIGAIVGALIPRSQREIDTLAPIGDRIRTAAGSAGAAAKVAAFDKIAELGLSKADLVAKAKTVVAEAASAARETGTAAASAGTQDVRS